jgi:hypothetical protein
MNSNIFSGHDDDYTLEQLVTLDYDHDHDNDRTNNDKDIETDK